MAKSVVIFNIFVLFFVCGCFGIKREWPSSIPRCNAGDEACIPKTLSQLFSKSDDIPELNMPRIDPFVWPKTVVLRTRNPNAPINIVIRNSNTTIYGLKNMVVTAVSGFGPDPRTSKFEIKSRVPTLTSEANYKSTMNLFSLPITTEGISNTTLRNVEIRQVFDTKVVERDGKEYLDIKGVRISLTVSKLSIHFNSHTGSEQINDTVNKVVNENWKDIYYELKPDLEKSIGDIIKALLKPVFNEIPYKEFYLPQN